jgi:Double-GTPase 2
MRQQQARVLAERLCRPQRLGVFGHRGVGKTTLLSVLYREAVGGRLPELRLAAADARTAEHLAEKITQLEAGRVLPATLAETELRWQLYHCGSRIELLAKDYQGEHVELGRAEPIREFLRDCDAVWLCLDAATLSAPEERRGRQQEVEQFVEDVLSREPRTTLPRPVALLLTKADLLGADFPGRDAEAFDLCRHALHTHFPNSARFAVSSLAALRGAVDRGHLAEPLAWLAAALQAQDEARLERLWESAGDRVALLERCVACFARRYPEAPATPVWWQRLADLRRGRNRRRGLLGAAAAACLTASLWGYDAWGYHHAERFEAEHAADPAAALSHWQQYQAWHPTRYLLGAGSARAEAARLSELAAQARRRDCDDRLAELRRQVADPDADPEAVWLRFQEFRARHPEASVAGDLEQLRSQIKARRDAQFNQKAQRAYDDLLAAEGRGTDLNMLLSQADRFLQDFAGTPSEEAVRRLHAACVRRLDERDIEAARSYSARQPFNFQTRREHYQRYLDAHPAGAFAAEAQTALQAIAADWDKHDFRSVRDQYVNRPGDLPELVARCRSYLTVHPHGRFVSAATDLLRWSERVSVPGEYRVVLHSGRFEHGIARLLSRGPDLSVELEVGGIRYGPSTIVRNRYDPQWDYEFPRRVRWKLGDSVVIRVTDHDWWRRVVAEFRSDDGDPLAMRLLAGETWCGGNRLTFESDFTLPSLSAIE